MNRFPASLGVLLASLPILSLATIPGCSGGGGGHAATVGGTWEGTWESSSPLPSGSFTLVLGQQGVAVSGTAIFEGHPCLATCNVACQALGHGLSGILEAGPIQVAFAGTCAGPHHGGGPGIDTMSGSYEIHGGACDGERGTIQLTYVGTTASESAPVGAVRVGEVIIVGSEVDDVVRMPVMELRSRERGPAQDRDR